MATIKEVVNIAKDSVNVVFEDLGEFSYEPGQFITIISEVDGNKVRRAYSLCTTPFEDVNPAVTVKRVPGGAMSNFLNDRIKGGDQIEIMEPMGMFTTDYKASNNRTAVFIGGGSGITPLISIIRSILIKEPNSRTVLIYANRSIEYVIFKDLFEELSTKHPEQFKVLHVLESGEADYSGRLTNEMIADICSQENCNEQTEFYICGPQPMMDIAHSGLEAAGYPKANIRMESFEVGKTSPSDEKKVSGESNVTILLDGDEHVIKVNKNASILDTALEADLDMPYSCQSGLCTACRGKCLEGEISIDEAEGLSQEELDDGYVLTCVGKPVSDTVRVEIG